MSTYHSRGLCTAKRPKFLKSKMTAGLKFQRWNDLFEVRHFCRYQALVYEGSLLLMENVNGSFTMRSGRASKSQSPLSPLLGANKGEIMVIKVVKSRVLGQNKIIYYREGRKHDRKVIKGRILMIFFGYLSDLFS